MSHLWSPVVPRGGWLLPHVVSCAPYVLSNVTYNFTSCMRSYIRLVVADGLKRCCGCNKKTWCSEDRLSIESPSKYLNTRFEGLYCGRSHMLHRTLMYRPTSTRTAIIQPSKTLLGVHILHSNVMITIVGTLPNDLQRSHDSGSSLFPFSCDVWKDNKRLHAVSRFQAGDPFEGAFAHCANTHTWNHT